MKILNFQEREEWLLWRVGKFTGSKIKDIVTKNTKGEYVFGTPKIGIYHAIAGRFLSSAQIADDEDPEKAMARGTRLEPVAIQRFKDETGKKVVWCNDDIGWEREDDSSIAVSPDAYIGKTEAVEAKCLSAARHLQVIDTGEIPKEYEYQVLQYFVVSDSLRKVHVVFYDDRLPTGLDYFVITVDRKNKKEEIAALLQHERDWLKVVREKTNKLSERIAPVQYVKITPDIFKDMEYEVTVAVEPPMSDLDRIHAGIMERSI